MSNLFATNDQANLIGPLQAFDPTDKRSETVAARKHHLVLEVVAHLQQDAVPFVFRGGTALHTKLRNRVRFSVDADLTTTDAPAIHAGLRDFVARFPNSEIELVDPPADLRVDGVAHTLLFHRGGDTPTRIYIEVVEMEATHQIEPFGIQADGFDWRVEASGPTFPDFAGQKLAVLGPNTIGKEVGRREEFSRRNDGVCKQLFDLQSLFRMDLPPDAVAGAYKDAVIEANELRGTGFESADCLNDMADLLSRLKAPRAPQWADINDDWTYGLWRAHRASRKWIAPEGQSQWAPRDYRILAGSLHRLANILLEEPELLPLATEPIRSRPDVDRVTALDGVDADWMPIDGPLDAHIAWAWAPREFW